MTMHHIATQTIGNNSTTSITFSSIPQTFSALQIRISGGIYAASGSGGSAWYMSGFNGISSTRHHHMYGDGSGYTASSDSNVPVIFCPYNSTPAHYAAAILEIPDYASTNKHKVLKSLSGYDTNGIGVTGLMSILWANSAAINSLSFGSGGGYFATGSRVDLYGITSTSVTGA